MKLCRKCGNDDRTPSGNCRPCSRKVSKEWREKNKDRHRKYHREYARKNKQELNARKRQRYASNPEVKRKQYLANQTWRTNSRAPGNIKPEDVAALFAKYAYACVSCSSEEDLSIDHIVPVSKGGKTVLNNLQPLCRSCNAKKGTSIIDYRPDSNEDQWTQQELL